MARLTLICVALFVIASFNGVLGADCDTVGPCGDWTGSVTSNCTLIGQYIKCVEMITDNSTLCPTLDTDTIAAKAKLNTAKLSSFTQRCGSCAIAASFTAVIVMLAASFIIKN